MRSTLDIDGARHPVMREREAKDRDSWQDVFDNEMSPSLFRQYMSGLKRDLPPWEDQVCLAEIAAGEWQPTAEMRAAEKKRLAVVRRKHSIAKKTMPKSQKKAFDFWAVGIGGERSE